MENSYTNQTINTDQLLNMFPDTTIEEWQCCYHAYNQNFVDCYKSYQDTSIYLDTNHVIACWFDNNKDNSSLLALFRTEYQRPFNYDDRLLAQRFNGHFQKALDIQKKHHNLNTISDRVVDALALPIFITDDKEKVLHLNVRADHLLKNTHNLILDAEGNLRCTNSAKNKELITLIAKATRNKPMNGAMFLDADKIEQIFVQPLPVTPLFNLNCKNPLALIMKTEANISSVTLQLLGKLYQLTPAELRVASALMQGKSPDNHAKVEGVTINTIRIHLKMVLRKTNTRRQAELVALLSAAPMLNGL